MNERGVLTLDFIFALVITSAASIVLLSLCYTLVVVEAAQYIAFSSARAYFAGNINPTAQEKYGNDKFSELMAKGKFGGFFDGTYFELKKESGFDFAGDYGASPEREIFLGVRLGLSAPILFKQFPFVGNTADGPEGFNAKITAFLGREPSDSECMNVLSQRWEAIKQNSGASGVPGTAQAVVIADNGC